jgi:hypothetical protein
MRVLPTARAALIGFVLAARTTAASPERVALVRPETQSPMLLDAWNRLAAELRIHQFEVDVVEARGPAVPTTPALLSEAARSVDALAAILLVESEAGKAHVDVWLVDRTSGKTLMRTIAVRKGEDASSVLAIRAVDLLRGSLREFETGERPPPDVLGVDRRPVPPAIAKLSLRPEPRLHLRAEALVVDEGARFGAALGPSLGLSHRTTDWVELGVVVSGPLLGAKLETKDGSATTHQELGLFEGRFSVFHSPHFDANLNVAAGVHFLSAEGQPRPPLLSRSDHVTSFLGAVGLGADVKLSRHVAVSVTLRAAGTAPRVGVAVASQSAAFPFPLLLASAGIVVGL